MTAIHDLTLQELSAALSRRAYSSVEVTRHMLGVIERTDDRLDAYLSVDADAALKQAESADKVRAAGGHHPLLGVPLAVKELLNVEGQPCTCGSRILEGYTAAYDATVIARLREAGTVFLGRVNMDEFAMGSSTENSAFKVTRNPWQTDHVPGGSSGGSAAAVAAREAPASIATDTGGSIRQPAAFCGCVGLKPTYGRVSRYGLTAYASSLDQIGPVTRTVGDAALLLNTLAGQDPMDATSAKLPVPDYTAALKDDLQGMKLGLPAEYFVEGIDPQVEQMVRQAVDQCRELGAEIIEISLPHTRYAIAAYYIIATAEASANLARYDGVRYGTRVDGKDPIDMYGNTRAAGFGPEVKRRVILGTYVLSSGYYDAYYLRAQKVRTLIARDFEEAFRHCDALLTPVAPTAAFRIGAKTDDPLQMYLTDIFTVTANLAGLCGMSVPCGFTGTGLPVGLQVLGPAFCEDRILRVGHAYEQATDWHRKVPAIHG